MPDLQESFSKLFIKLFVIGIVLLLVSHFLLHDILDIPGFLFMVMSPMFYWLICCD